MLGLWEMGHMGCTKGIALARALSEQRAWKSLADALHHCAKGRVITDAPAVLKHHFDKSATTNFTKLEVLLLTL